MAGLAKIALVMRHEAWRAAGSRGLTPTQMQILAVLASEDRPRGLSAVASDLALSPGTASEAISTLVAKGLVRKARSEDDGRAIVLGLTAAGRREAAMAGRWPAGLIEAARGLPRRERDFLLRGIIALIRGLQDRGAITTARMCVGCTYFRPNEYPGSPTPHHCLLVDAPMADSDLRIDCPEMEPAAGAEQDRLWQVFLNGEPLDGAGPGTRRSPSESRRSVHSHS